jgi:hypothetical protein
LYFSFYPPLVESTQQFAKCSSSVQKLLSSCCTSATLPLRFLRESRTWRHHVITSGSVLRMSFRGFRWLSVSIVRAIITLNMARCWRNLVSRGFYKTAHRLRVFENRLLRRIFRPNRGVEKTT